MRAKTLLIALFVGSLVVAGFAFMQVMPKGGATTPKQQILAATMPLAAGTLLRAQDVTWQGVSETEPDQTVRPNAATLESKPELDDQTRASVYGAVLRHALAAGEPIRRGAFVKPGERDFLQVVLSPGERAIAIPVSTGGASTGLLQPGDRVDVVLTQNFKNDTANDLKNTPLTRRSVGETVVENLRVLAIDALDTKATTTAANPANGNFGRTVTLEVTPEQVEQINVAAELGKLSVALRSITGPTTLAAVSPDGNTDQVVKPTDTVVNHVKPTWAGDVSPALYGAAEPKPVALTPPTVQVFHGAGKEGGGTNGQPGANVRSEIIKTEN
jgi:pilus assembly protein CpaB